MNRVFKALAIAFTVVVALVSCKKEDQPKEVALTGIELNATSQTLQVGQEFQLTVTYKPENATNKPAATWASDTPAVATVDGGKVVAVAAGTAKITATVGTFTAECAVTVASAEEEILPVEGNSDWSIIGALLGTNWDKDFVAAKDGDIYVVKNVKLAASDQFKFRKDKDWGVNRGAEGDVEPFKLTAGTAITVIHNGKNLAAPGDGIYDIYYNAAVEQVCLVAKDGTPKWNEPEVKGLIDIDGDLSDWAEIEAVTVGNHTVKYAKDENFVYIYSQRAKDEQFDALWGSSEGYVYFALDLDKNPATGDQTLWSNGPFEYVGVIWPYGGTKEAPVVNKTPDSAATSTGAAISGLKCDGKIDADGVAIEFAVPVSAFPAFPETPYILYSWGSTGLSKVEYHVGEPQPAPEYVHDYTPSAEYLAETNLWKAVDAAGSDFFIINCINGEWPRSAEASSEGVYALTHEQSTYKMHYDVASTEDWQRQLFLFPKAENAIAIEEGVKYNVKVTFYANKDLPRVFMKVVNYQADKDNKEGAPLLFGDEIKSVKAGQPTVFEYKDVAGAANTENLTFVIDFGGAPADVDIYVKDIIIEKAGAVIDTWDYTPSDKYLAVTNLWKPADGLDAVNWTLGEGLTKPEVSFSQSTYTFTLAEESNDIQSTQFRVVSNNITLDPAKKYNFYCKVYSSAGTKLWLKAHPDPNTHWPELFETAGYDVAGDRMVIEAGETKEIALENIEASLYPEIITKQCIMFDLSPHAANNLIHIKDIIIEEVAAAPAFTGITIDGDMSDWASVPGAEPASVFKAFKVWNDADNFYFYVATDPGSRLWEGGAYLYLYFDWDNDLTTGEYSGTTGMGSNKYEAYTYMFIFENNQISAPTSDSVAKGLSLDNIQIAGSTSAAEVCEIEIAIPRADFAQQVTAGTVIGVNSYRSKDGGNVNFPGYVVK